MSRLVFEEVKQNQIEYSICIPTYKRPDLLIEALESCFRQEGNIPFEIVVSDNDPESDISKIINCYKKHSPNITFRYFKNEKNIGMFGNWNQLVGLAKADWITILNDDDLLSPGFLKSIAVLRKEYPEYLLLSCERVVFDQRKGVPKNRFSRIRNRIFEVLRNRDFEVYGFDFFINNKINGTLGAVFHRSVFEKTHGFEESMFPSSDYYFWMYFHLQHSSLRSFSRECIYRIQQNESLKVDLIPLFLKHDEDIKNLYIKKRSRFSRPLMRFLSKALLSRSEKKIGSERYLDQRPRYSLKTHILALFGVVIYYAYLFIYVLRVVFGFKKRTA